MSQRVLLHVGTPKSGTTYLQSLLWSNSDKLAEQGVLCPGRRRVAHRRAVRALHGQYEVPIRAWTRLVDEIANWPGTAVISDELLSATTVDQARQIVSDLRPGEVEIIITAREFGSLIPSVWQQRLKRGLTTSLADFNIPTDDGSVWSWWALDPAQVAGRWREAVDPRHIYVLVTGPTANHDLLWKRFAAIAGVDPGSCSTDDVRENTSMSHAAAEVLRRVVEELGPDYASRDISRRWIKGRLAEPVLTTLEGARPPLLPHAFALAAEQARTSAHELSAGGYRVVGDVDDLMPQGDPPLPPGASQLPTDVELMKVAVTTIARLLAHWRAEHEARGPSGG